MHSESSLAYHIEPALVLRNLPDDELLRCLGELVSDSRRVEADLVSHIGEVDERKLYAREACPSMFVYCTERLHLSEAEAYRRITVARAARKHPMLLAMLRDGRLHLSGLATLVPLLNAKNCEAVLERATHLTKRQVEELVADLSPRPDAPSVIRRLPRARPAAAMSAVAGDADRTGRTAVTSSWGTVSAVTRPDGELVPGRVRLEATAATAALSAADPALVSPFLSDRAPSRSAVVEPTSPARYKVQFTASAELRDKIERLTALMRSEVPDGDLASVLKQAVSEKLERLESRRYAQTKAPRKGLSDSDTAPTSRHSPAAVRRAVLERDEGRCRYVDESGRRCSERDRLEFHHRHPFGMGGDHSLTNVRLLCPSHNRYVAEQDYGQAAIRSRIDGQARLRL